MPKERPPQDALPVGFKPLNGTAYRVQDGDDWYSVGRDKRVRVDDLIWFNFHTEDPDEINWYLSHRTGCNKATRDRLNWMFSASARPGIIYVPPAGWHKPRHHPATKKVAKPNIKDMSAITITVNRKGVTSPFAKKFERPVDQLEEVAREVDTFTVIDMGLAIAGLELGAVWMIAGFAAAFAAPWLALGSGESAALTEIRTRHTKRGLALGIILGADGRSDAWILDHGFVKKVPPRLLGFEPYEKQVMNIYNTSFTAGLVHGRLFSTVALVHMLSFLGSKMTNLARAEYLGYPKEMSGKEWEAYSRTWSAKKWIHYYDLLAALLEDHVLKD